MSAVGNHNTILAYTHIPTSAFRIPEPDLSSPPPDPHDPRHSFSAGSDGPRTRSRLASFPPNNAGLASKKGTIPGSKGDGLGGIATGGGGLGSALSSGVTDMFISHLLPSTLPSKAVPQASLPVPGKVRALSSQRESLSLPVMTNSFRRFVARCGTIFWVEDRVEEVLYWRKPVWTLSWMLLWGFICFYPRILLLIPFCVIILILLHQHTKTHPTLPPPTLQSTSPTTVPAPKASLLNNALTNSIAATLTQNNDPSVNSKARGDVDRHQGSGKVEERYGATGSAVGADGREIPAVSGGPPESGVDYYMNLQGIQNFMGLFSDVHDAVLPFISLIVPSMPSPSPPPTTFPLSATHLMILLLPPTILLPLIPMSLLSYLLLPIGILPPVIYHPAFLPALERARRWEGLDWKKIRRWRGVAERWVLTDRLDDAIARSEIREVRVWENQRLDAGWLADNESRLRSLGDDKRPRSGSGSKVLDNASGSGGKDTIDPPESAWSSTFLKTYERAGWVRALPTKIRPGEESLWEDGEKSRETGQANAGGRIALSLVKGWSFVPGEDWRVDWVAEWDRTGGDDAGWIYTDDDWQQPSSDPVINVVIPEKLDVETQYQVTRRRQWWRRVYSTE